MYVLINEGNNEIEGVDGFLGGRWRLASIVVSNNRYIKIQIN